MMRSAKSTVFHILATIAFVLSSHCVQAAGFQRGFAADPSGSPLEIGIWYPSQATPKSVSISLFTMSVALNGAVEGRALPLVVLSHGTGSSFMGHYDTAIALADAGFVVVSVTHAGDNYADQSRSTAVMDRPKQISRVIDHMLSSWDAHTTIDPARIGMFGFSAGAFTTLLSVGGLPDFSTIGPMCREHPADFACQLIARSSQKVNTVPSTSAVQDQRITAAVVAAPALGFVFSREGLRNINVPLQLWRAEDDEVLPHPRYAESVRWALPEIPDYHVVSKAGHYDFLAPCSRALENVAPQICKSNPDFDRAAFHQTFNSSVVEFFEKYLKHG